ncbi:MAG: TIGR00282 family metallophosphoesterase [Armatimonadetes bacterium]|nr:TIGR00282 family metallophosphoesterase [Armatimonadota bacterium]
MRILFLGDIVGKTGRQAVEATLPILIEQYNPDFVLANGENAAAGLGITPDIADRLFATGVDGITLGNHAFQKRDIPEYLNSNKNIIRPANFPPGTAGRGTMTLEKNGMKLSVANFCGRVFMAEYDDPFRGADKFISEAPAACKLIDFHCEATSEKMAFGYYVDGRVSAVIGTHTHVQTADERILGGGTAFITDVGMCGPQDSVIGMDREIILRRFTTLMPEKFEVAGGPSVISGVVVNVKDDTGAAESIERILLRDIK